jgi:hypothetical protein
MKRMVMLLLMCLMGSAQGAVDHARPPGPDPRTLADGAMKLVAADDVKGFIVYIREHMQIDSAQIDKLSETLTTQRKPLAKMLGKNLGYVFISECRRADTLVRLVYAEKREKSVLRWQFIFYKPRDQWRWVNFHWDEDLPQLFVDC